MRRALAAVLVGALGIVTAGCGGSHHQRVSSRPPGPPRSRGALATIHYRAENLTLYAAPPAYRPAVSRAAVLDSYGRLLAPGPKLTGTPTVQLRTVDDGNPNPKARDYPGWVLTFHHTKPVSYGPARISQKADCDWVVIFDLRTRVWTESFQNCPGRPARGSSCDAGCTPANQPALDAAASYAQRIAGAAHCYAGSAVDDPANKVVVYLVHAPASVIDALDARHPGIYVVHDDAPRTLREVMALQRSIDWSAWKARGIDIVSTGPTETGYLRAGVTTSVAKAQAAFDARYGHGVVRVVKGEVVTAWGAAPDLTQNVPCYNAGRQHPVGPATLRRFHAVAAVSCVEGTRTYPGRGQWWVRIRRVAAGSVAGLQRYFEQPDGPKPRRGRGCLLVARIIVVPTFVDRHGRWLVPRTPVDACGEPRSGYGRLFRAVRWHVVWVRRVRLMVSAAALAALCSMEIKDLPAGGIGALDRTSGGPLFRIEPKTVRVCIYRRPANDVEVGRFVRGFALGAAQTRRLLAAMTRPAPRGSCPEERTFAVVHAQPALWAEVELGGCFRVGRTYPGYGLGGSDPSVVRAILGGR